MGFIFLFRHFTLLRVQPFFGFGGLLGFGGFGGLGVTGKPIGFDRLGGLGVTGKPLIGFDGFGVTGGLTGFGVGFLGDLSRFISPPRVPFVVPVGVDEYRRLILVMILLL